MSIRTVRAEIKKAMQTRGQWEDKSVTRKEAQQIVGEAERGPVTPGEVREVEKVVEKGIAPAESFTLALPELRGDAFFLEPDAKRVLQSFIERHVPPSPDQHVTLAIPENPTDSRA
jgi:hypothetical protein